MEVKGVPKSCHIVTRARDDSLCAMYFGVSCAFFALKYLSEKALDEHKCLETSEKLLQGSAHLLGLLVLKVHSEEEKTIEKCELLHKLEVAEREIVELKRMRSEDAKANERVASIYAAQEQSWFAERRRLRQQVGGLLNDLRILDKRKYEAVSELNAKLNEMENVVKSKDKMLEEEERRRKELEEKVEELRENAKREAQDHSAELLKQKTAFIELVSNQRQLEAELGRTLRQVEAAKQQLEFVFEEKEEAVLMVQKLAMEMEKKDNILSAMIRKSKLEVKLSKPKRNKAENEAGKLRRMLSRQLSSRLEFLPAERRDDVFGGLDDEVRKEDEEYSLHLKQSLPQQSTEFDEATRLDEWVHLEAEKYHDAVERRHQLELDAFEEQMRLKDAKLEAYRWKLRSMEVESKRLQSQLEGLNQDMSQLRHDNLKLEALLLDREVELKTLKDHIELQLNNLSAQKAKVKVMKKKPADKELEPRKEDDTGLSKETSSTASSSTEDIEQKEVLAQSNPACIDFSSPKEPSKREKSPWKVDLHALGVSYKIKRLSQQLLMLDRLTGKQENSGIKRNEEHGQMKMKGFVLLLSLLNKQVSRYQSLQEKIDDLSQRMGVEKDLHVKQGVSSSTRTKEETRTLEHFLEETFQLQRFTVATGQKLIELQAKIASGFVGISEEFDGSVTASFDIKRFAETIQSLFKDVQRGLEVRISRIIGDLGGTLACDGIHSRK